MTVGSREVRDELGRLLAADLVGPWESEDETVVGNPRGRYLAGALAPVKVSSEGELPPPTLPNREPRLARNNKGSHASRESEQYAAPVGYNEGQLCQEPCWR